MTAQDNIREVSVKSYYAAYLGRRAEIRQLLFEVTGLLQQFPLTRGEAGLSAAVYQANRRFPFVKLVYLLDAEGRQISNNIAVAEDRQVRIDKVIGRDRSQRPYFDHDASGMIITEPYISLADGEVCISLSFQCQRSTDDIIWAVVDCNLTEVMSYLYRYMF